MLDCSCDERIAPTHPSTSLNSARGSRASTRAPCTGRVPCTCAICTLAPPPSWPTQLHAWLSPLHGSAAWALLCFATFSESCDRCRGAVPFRDLGLEALHGQLQPRADTQSIVCTVVPWMVLQVSTEAAPVFNVCTLCHRCRREWVKVSLRLPHGDALVCTGAEVAVESNARGQGRLGGAQQLLVLLRRERRAARRVAALQHHRSPSVAVDVHQGLPRVQTQLRH
mmetsp:Transcript_93105/g.247300  ORF Transcript_93105/g.247300 Transcript_93105/m.247300 type:complete len:225 (+) Transcript_93105:20-694(+)